MRLAIGVEECATHAHLGCIGGADEGGDLRHNLCEVGQMEAEAGTETCKVVDVIAGVV